MKKIGLLLGLVLLLAISISFISAIDINLEKSSYNSMETLEAEISGGFIDNLILDNIGIYQEGAVHKSPVESNLIKYENKYYYYAIVPESAGTYYLRIENTKHYVGTKESSETVEKSFTVSESNASYLNFNPGIIYTSKDFSITITAFNKNQDITVDFPEAKFKQTFNLGYNQVKTVYISIANVTNTTNSHIKIGSYSMPAIVVTQNKNPKNTSLDKDFIDLKDVLNLSISEIRGTMLKGIPNYYEIYITGINETTPDLRVSASNENIISSLEGENQNVIMVTISGKESFKGFINLSSEDSSIILPVDIQVTQDPSKVNDSVNNSTKPLSLTCSEMKGNYCLEGQTCSALQKTDSIGNLCCIGECKTSSSSSKWLWIILILIILGVGAWFLYKKAQGSEDFKKFTSKIISNRSEDYKKRIESEPKEVRSGLTKN